jgi:hypothetical protein
MVTSEKLAHDFAMPNNAKSSPEPLDKNQPKSNLEGGWPLVWWH